MKDFPLVSAEPNGQLHNVVTISRRELVTARWMNSFIAGKLIDAGAPLRWKRNTQNMAAVIEQRDVNLTDVEFTGTIFSQELPNGDSRYWWNPQS